MAAPVKQTVWDQVDSFPEKQDSIPWPRDSRGLPSIDRLEIIRFIVERYIRCFCGIEPLSSKLGLEFKRLIKVHHANYIERKPQLNGLVFEHRLIGDRIFKFLPHALVSKIFTKASSNRKTLESVGLRWCSIPQIEWYGTNSGCSLLAVERISGKWGHQLFETLLLDYVFSVDEEARAWQQERFIHLVEAIFLCRLDSLTLCDFSLSETGLFHLLSWEETSDCFQEPPPPYDVLKSLKSLTQIHPDFCRIIHQACSRHDVDPSPLWESAGGFEAHNRQLQQRVWSICDTSSALL